MKPGVVSDDWDCDGSIPPYPWGTSAAGFPDPDADGSGTYPELLPGDEGICKSLLDVTRERTEERGAAEETGETVVEQRTAATTGAVVAAQWETAAVPEKPPSAKEAATAQDAEQQQPQEKRPKKEHPEKVGEPSGFNPIQQMLRPGSST
ncbi:hypothetical protein NDU88_005521 [Pleurodeles waltl]|uniref:Uncharacterized protein n=1 Tax=Pleurodeles waltl TaxID=8319 RepID=A0AAV7VMA0_PLEWA|nr:hypothetical protein NDU88_005521 [Pleurodeles waltl]